MGVEKKGDETGTEKEERDTTLLSRRIGTRSAAKRNYVRSRIELQARRRGERTTVRTREHETAKAIFRRRITSTYDVELQSIVDKLSIILEERRWEITLLRILHWANPIICPALWTTHTTIPQLFNTRGCCRCRYRYDIQFRMINTFL